MSKVFMAVLVFACIAIEAPDAAAKNNPSVTGGFTSRLEQGPITRLRKVNINVVRKKNGSLTGRIDTTEKVYVNGVFASETSFKADADELIIIGNRGYVRAGGMFFVVVDNGQGSTVAPDKSFAITFAGPPPPLALYVGTLDILVGFAGSVTVKGNAQVRG